MLVDVARYHDGQKTRLGDLAATFAGTHRDGGFVWAGLHDPQPAEIDEIISVFELHPVAAEDVITGQQRPKVERYDDWLFVVLRTARYLDEPESVEFGEIQILCHSDAVIVIRHGEPVPLDGLRHRLEETPGALADGPVEILHAVIDEVVDSYEAVLTGLDDDVSEVELDVFSDDQRGQSAQLIERIYFLQREVLGLHRALTPLLAMMPTVRADGLVIDHDRWDAYFRDVQDHVLRQADQLQTIRELIAAALTANTAQVTLRQNDDMRRISAWVAIAAVPTMLAGIYGMNFEHIPEFGWELGYPLVLVVMLAACLSLYRSFRRSGWL